MITYIIIVTIRSHRKGVNRLEKKKGLFKVVAVAERLGISIPHTYRLAATGEIPCIRIGGKSIRFEEAAVDRFIREHRHKKAKAA